MNRKFVTVALCCFGVLASWLVLHGTLASSYQSGIVKNEDVGQESQVSPPVLAGLEKSKLRILFVGRNPDTKVGAPQHVKGSAAERFSELRQERMAAYKLLLEEHFESVRLLNVEDYKPSMSDDYDVTVFDSLPPPVDSVKIGDWTKYLRMPKDFDRPALMIGDVAPRTLGRLGLDLRLDHL